MKACRRKLISFSKFTNAFIKPFKMTIIFSSGLFVHTTFFYFASLLRNAIFAFDSRMTQEISKGETGSGK